MLNIELVYINLQYMERGMFFHLIDQFSVFAI